MTENQDALSDAQRARGQALFMSRDLLAGTTGLVQGAARTDLFGHVGDLIEVGHYILTGKSFAIAETTTITSHSGETVVELD